MMDAKGWGRKHVYNGKTPERKAVSSVTPRHRTLASLPSSVPSNSASARAAPDFLEHSVCNPKDSLYILHWKHSLCKILLTFVKGKCVGPMALKRNPTYLTSDIGKRKGFPVRWTKV